MAADLLRALADCNALIAATEELTREMSGAELDDSAALVLQGHHESLALLREMAKEIELALAEGEPPSQPM